RSSLRHQGPPYVDHLFRVGSAELLKLSAFGFGELVGEPEDLGQRVGLGLHRNAGTTEFLPDGDDNERQQHRVDDTKDGVDEASHVVMLLADAHGHKALHQHQPDERGEASPTNHQNPINYEHRQRTIPLSFIEIAGGTQDTSWRVYKQTGSLGKPGVEKPLHQHKVGPPRTRFTREYG